MLEQMKNKRAKHTCCLLPRNISYPIAVEAETSLATSCSGLVETQTLCAAITVFPRPWQKPRKPIYYNDGTSLHPRSQRPEHRRRRHDPMKPRGRLVLAHQARYRWGGCGVCVGGWGSPTTLKNDWTCNQRKRTPTFKTK